MFQYFHARTYFSPLDFLSSCRVLSIPNFLTVRLFRTVPIRVVVGDGNEGVIVSQCHVEAAYHFEAPSQLLTFGTLEDFIHAFGRIGVPV